MPVSSLAQTLTQKTTLTLQQRRSIEILQLSGPQLQSEILAQLDANPLLEADMPDDLPAIEDEMPSADAGVAQDFRNPGLLSWRTTPAVTEDYDPFGTVASTETLTDHLLFQLGCLHISERDKTLCAWLIGNLDENGFLTDSLEELVQQSDLTERLDVLPEEWSAALTLLQSFEPAGVGARDAAHSLLLQLRSRDCEPQLTSAATKLLTDAPLELARRDFKAAGKKTGLDADTVQAAHALILTLNPHPAAQFADTRENSCVIAEIMIVRENGRWCAKLNPQAVSRLHFCEKSFELLTHAKLSKEENAVWREKAAQAKGFVRSLEMRYSTIAAVAQCIADIQQEFFTEGEAALKPMALKDISARLGLAESTVSRAVSGKYMQTPRGTFKLKKFFTSALVSDGVTVVSAAATRKLIREAVASEDPAKPLSDTKICELLAAQGVHLARRTVAKYREIEGIAPKALRRKAQST